MKGFSSVKILNILFMVIFLIKVLAVICIKETPLDFISLGGDSNYYDEYALGLDVPATSIWPKILRLLNDNGLYDRNIISWILFILSSLIIPFLFASLIPKPKVLETRRKYKLIFWFIAIMIAIYPTLFFYSIDVYRDVVMVFLFGVSLHLAKALINSPQRQRVLNFIIFSLISYVLYLFRPYLGFSVFLAIIIYRIKFGNIGIFYLTLCYLFLLIIADSMHAFNALFSYREIFHGEYEGASTNLGISFLGKTSVDFVTLYIYSGLLQLFGLYFEFVKTMVLFFTESLLFIYCMFYCIKNRHFLTPFLKYILYFSIIYGTIWIVANDNLGTATRLRLFNYLSMLIIATTIYLSKHYILHEKRAVL